MKYVIYIQGEKCIIPGYKLHCKSDTVTQQTIPTNLGGTFRLNNGDLLHVSPIGQMSKIQEYGVEFGLESGRKLNCIMFNSSEAYYFQAGYEYLSEDVCSWEDNTIVRIWENEGAYNDNIVEPWLCWDESYMLHNDSCQLIATLRIDADSNMWVLEDNQQYLPQDVGNSICIWSNCLVFDNTRYREYLSTSIILNKWVQNIVYAPTDRAPFSAQRSDNGLYCYIFTEDIYTKTGDQIHIVNNNGNTTSYQYNGTIWVQIT